MSEFGKSYKETKNRLKGKNDEDLFENISTTIDSYKISRNKKGKKHTVYLIEVSKSTDDDDKWIVKRTYGDFKWLDDKLGQLYKRLPAKIPKEKLLGKREPNFLENRKILLRKYIQKVAVPKYLCGSVALRSWLDMDDEGHHNPPPTTSGINQRSVAVGIALYDYEAEKEEDLSFKKGDMISITRMNENDGWMKGKLNGKTGKFPETYVELVQNTGLVGKTSNSNSSAQPSSQQQQQPQQQQQQQQQSDSGYWVAIADFAPTSSGDLGFQSGEILTITSQDSADWWTGLNSYGQTGQVPASYLEPWEEEEEEYFYENGGGGGVAGAKAKALFAYSATDITEISFNEGDIIEVLDHSTGEWWEGSIDGMIGSFPSNYVELMDSSSGFTSTNTTSTTSNTGSNDTKVYEVMLAAYAYTPVNDGDLTLSEGDVIFLTSNTKGDWMTGTCKGVSGTFPSSYVTHSPQKKTVAYTYEAQGQTDVSVKAGDLVHCESESGGWSLVHLCNGQVGNVPSNYLQ